MNAFILFDKDKSGSIDAKELYEILGNELKGYSNTEIWENMIKEVDQNGDGKVDFAEFMKMMYTSKYSPPAK